MADIFDVTRALGKMIEGYVYPKGLDKPSAVVVPVRIVEGWPVTETLNADMAAGNVQISIFPTRQERNTTRFQEEWQTLSITAPTLSVTVKGTTVTLAGTSQVPQVVVVTVAGTVYPYEVSSPTMTLSSIASGLAALIPHATVSGESFTVHGAGRVSAAVSTEGQSIKEVRRQERGVQITIWAPNPFLRNRVVSLIDPRLADTPRIDLADGTVGQLVYQGSPLTDLLQKSRIFRRDLIYRVEFATTIIETDQTIGGFAVDIQPSFITTF